MKRITAWAFRSWVEGVWADGSWAYAAVAAYARPVPGLYSKEDERQTLYQSDPLRGSMNTERVIAFPPDILRTK